MFPCINYRATFIVIIYIIYCFRLLFHASAILSGNDVCLGDVESSESFSGNQFASDAMDVLKSLYLVRMISDLVN